VSDSQNAASSLQIEVSRKGAAAVVVVTGDVSSSTCGEFRTKLDSLVEQQIPVIVLDLGQVDTMCSLGLGAVMSAQIRSRDYGGAIRLVDPKPAIQKMLEATRFNESIRVFPTREAALDRSGEESGPQGGSPVS
jgi:stage II sporulation protein AA (anti-sigma F factor antagonist)